MIVPHLACISSFLYISQWIMLPIMSTLVFFLGHFAAFADDVIYRFKNLATYFTFPIFSFIDFSFNEDRLMTCSWAARMGVFVPLLLPLFCDHFFLSSPVIPSVIRNNWPCKTLSLQLSLRFFALRSFYSFAVSFASISDLQAARKGRSLLS